jgi:hypothetical protein
MLGESIRKRSQSGRLLQHGICVKMRDTKALNHMNTTAQFIQLDSLPQISWKQGAAQYKWCWTH